MGQNVFSLPIIVAETGVNAVTDPTTSTGGWVSGTPAGLADGATGTFIFDLGINWRFYPLISIGILSTAATSLSSIQIISADTPSMPAVVTRRLKELDTPTSGTALATSFYTVTTSAGPQYGLFRPMGRYVIVQAINTAAAGAQGANSRVTLAAYPV